MDHSIFTLSGCGIHFEDSPGGRVEHNTATACTVTLVRWTGHPSENIVIQYNSLGWNNNQILSIMQPLDILRNRCVIDYNNYGTTFKQTEGTATPHGKFGKSLTKPFPYLPRNREFHLYKDSTDPSNTVNHVSVNLEDWQTLSGQDQHSIFADPKWMDPKKNRFDVAKDSPNLLPNGKVIGALGYSSENHNLGPDVVLRAPIAEKIKTTFTLIAEAADYDGSIQKVEFYDKNHLIGEAMAAPYQIVELKLAPGCHVITAKAIDNQGAATVSDAVRINL